jgi:hypothetical protein
MKAIFQPDSGGSLLSVFFYSATFAISHANPHTQQQ